MPGTNLTREEAQARAALLDVTRTPSTWTSRPATRPSLDHHRSASPAASPAPRRSPTWSDATVHEITLNGERPRPGRRRTPNSRIALTGLAGRTTSSWSAPTAPTPTPARACTASSTPSTAASTSTRQFEVPDARRVFTTFEQPDLKSVVHLRRHRARAAGRSCPTPRRRSPRTSATAGPRWSFPRSKRMSTYITALIAGEYHEHPRHLRGQERHDPARALLPPVAGRAPRHRRAAEDHQAGLRVLRGGLRLPLPVREVRPALRAGVQRGRDGERRRRHAARRVPPAQPAGRRRSTSSAAR